MYVRPEGPSLSHRSRAQHLGWPGTLTVGGAWSRSSKSELDGSSGMRPPSLDDPSPPRRLFLECMWRVQMEAASSSSVCVENLSLPQECCNSVVVNGSEERRGGDITQRDALTHSHTYVWEKVNLPQRR